MATPKFANTLAWQQAELLMQPVFIRIIANIGKHLEESTWKGTYRDILLWADDVPDATKTAVTRLRQQLEAATTPEEAETIRETLAELPTPYPGYELCLESGGRQITVDLWQLCYQICFRNYSTVLNAMDRNFVVEIDTSLIDETGDVDWARLDQKAKHLIDQIFASLQPPDAETQS